MATENGSCCCKHTHQSNASSKDAIEKAYYAAIEKLNKRQSSPETIEKIKASGKLLNENSVAEFEAYLEKIGYKVEDLDRLNIVHVTGTKGKGSTCAFVSSIMQQVDNPHKLKVGLFTSPHLIEACERIRIDGKPISKQMFTKYFNDVYDRLTSATPPLRKVDPNTRDIPVYFRFINLMAVHVFLSEGVDVAIMEVGVGGQYDSTNAVRKPVVCGIASLGLDHQSSLGSTIESVAWHKAGIIKDGVPAFTVPQEDAAIEVIRSRAAERNAPVAITEPLPIGKYQLGIPGDHQRINAALAETLCREWVRIKTPNVDAAKVDSWVTKGIRLASWPGRSQTFVSPRHHNLTWHVDGAHTVESMTACAKWFAGERATWSGQSVLLFNAAHERSFDDLLQTLKKHAGKGEFVEAIFCPNLTSRADSQNSTVHKDEKLTQQHESARIWTELSGNTATKVFPNINAAVDYVESKYGSDSSAETHVLATGSLHLVGGVLDAAKGSI
ncbi:Folylpolyglutamate synthetase [Coemansia sp. RSA 1286]|nr:Folylpolyglutamate synthetase [Coemansia sp. RSA 1721]KAJ2638077.1 Folylpolyglutamate synthetase [Coemansia sp. RSA 1286]